MLNGETVKIASDGTILDGQHRLYACIQAGVPFETVVIRGLPPEAQDTIDTGMARKFADQLALRGEVNTPLLAAITRWAMRWLRGAKMGGAADLDPPTRRCSPYWKPTRGSGTLHVGRRRAAGSSRSTAPSGAWRGSCSTGRTTSPPRCSSRSAQRRGSPKATRRWRSATASGRAREQGSASTSTSNSATSSWRGTRSRRRGRCPGSRFTQGRQAHAEDLP